MKKTITHCPILNLRKSFKAALFILFLGLTGSVTGQTCLNPLDIHIANDISGSVSSREYLQSKDFVTQLGLTVPLGNGTQQSRIGSYKAPFISVDNFGDNLETGSFS